MRKPKSARAAADRATALVDVVRPIVARAMSDPELHEALRKALATGREVGGEVSGKKPSKAAKRIAGDRKLHRRVEQTAQELQRAVGNLVSETPKRRRRRRLRRVVTVIAGAAAAVGAVLAAKRFRGGGGGGGQA